MFFDVLISLVVLNSKINNVLFECSKMFSVEIKASLKETGVSFKADYGR